MLLCIAALVWLHPRARKALGGILGNTRLSKRKGEKDPADAAIEQAVSVREDAALEVARTGHEKAQQQIVGLEKKVEELTVAGAATQEELQAAKDVYENARRRRDELEAALQERIREHEKALQGRGQDHEKLEKEKQLSITVDETHDGSRKSKGWWPKKG